MSGAINLKKANEKSTFKRSKVLEKRRVSLSHPLYLLLSLFFSCKTKFSQFGSFFILLQESDSRLKLDTSDHASYCL